MVFTECLYNLVHSLTSHFLKIRFNIILPPVPLSIVPRSEKEVPWRVGMTVQDFLLYCLDILVTPPPNCQPVVTTNICVQRMTTQVQENKKYYTAGVKFMALRCKRGTNHGTPFYCLNINGPPSSSLLIKTLLFSTSPTCATYPDHYVLNNLSNHMEHLIT